MASNLLIALNVAMLTMNLTLAIRSGNLFCRTKQKKFAVICIVEIALVAFGCAIIVSLSSGSQ